MAFSVEYFPQRLIFRYIKKRVIFLPWKKGYRDGHVIFLIRLTKNVRKSKAQFAHLSCLFQVAVDCDFECVELQVIILEYFCTDYILLILFKHLDRDQKNIQVIFE